MPAQPRRIARDAIFFSLAPATVAELKAHRKAQIELRLRTPGWVDNDLVFPQSDGAFFPARNLARDFASVTKQAGLEGLRWHKCPTHGCDAATAGGRQPEGRGGAARPRLGVAFTLSTYASVLPDMAQDAAAVLAGVIRGGHRAVAEA